MTFSFKIGTKPLLGGFSMSKISLLFIMLYSLASFAKVEVLFHPHDPTFEKIADWILEAHSRIDIAMYSMDTNDKATIIKAIKSPEVQVKLESGELKMRLIYEGYENKKDNQKKMAALEELGIDVRYLGKSVKVHHKFAVIDPGSPQERVITGSANWSSYSYRGYDENILYLEREPEATYRYQLEFDRLWALTKPFGKDLGNNEDVILPAVDQKDFAAFFNSPRRFDKESPEPKVITDQIVRIIDSAKNYIQIATTRVRHQPLLEAILRAAERGVKIEIIISQDDYHDLQKRATWLLKNKNIQLRIKFYSLKPSDYMAFQMHNKFMIVDHSTVLTGSFNWSKSGEENHIENIVELNDLMAQEVLPDFEKEFSRLWNLGRDRLEDFEQKLESLKDSGKVPRCGFSPIVFDIDEIVELLKNNPKCW